MSEVRKHVHKLKRHVYKTGAKVYFCVDDCTFKLSVELAFGKRCICWRCGKPFAMNQYSITLAKPHCEECHIFKGQPKPKRDRRKTDLIQSSPAVELANAQGNSEISNLRNRLTALLEPPPVAVSNNSSSKPTIIEYRTNEEDEDLI